MTQDLNNVIRVKIEAFGAIERQLPNSNCWNVKPDSSVTEVLRRMSVAQSQLYTSYLERCACAMGEDIIPRQTI